MIPTAVITGASKGIGAALVEKFLTHGFSVVAIARDIGGLKALGPSVRPFACDLSSENDLGRLQILIDSLDRIDVLVNNAGVGFFETIEHTPADHWRQTIDVNLTGTFRVTQMAIPGLKRSSGAHIFNIGSTASRKGFIKWGAYAASKFGVLGLTQVLREEMRPYRIKVTSVLPGPVDTSFWRELPDGFDPAKMMAPSDVAQAVYAAYAMPANAVMEEIIMKPSVGDF